MQNNTYEKYTANTSLKPKMYLFYMLYIKYVAVFYVFFFFFCAALRLF